ncbi:hypothetical protein [Erwinia phage vB_Ea277G]|nr:hypothetical protein [Erwinia phage vB_Ea277G]
MSRKNNKSSQGKIDTSKISNVVPYRIATAEEVTAPRPEPAFLPKPEKEPAMSEVNPIVATIFGNTSVPDLMAQARANSFFDSPRYLDFKRFYQQNPQAVLGVVRQCFDAWRDSSFGIEVAVLEQDNLYVKDANQYKSPSREDDHSSLLTQVAYTLFARNEKELTELLMDEPDDGRGIMEIAETALREQNVDVLENLQFSRFWRDVAYS